jgi:hypothetical protein
LLELDGVLEAGEALRKELWRGMVSVGRRSMDSTHKGILLGVILSYDYFIRSPSIAQSFVALENSNFQLKREKPGS